MGVNISYMGTKRGLAPRVAEVIGGAQKGIVLDIFSGMCSVGEEIAPKRQIWTNDIQIFASEVGRALFLSQENPLSPAQASDIIFDVYSDHFQDLSALFRDSISIEREILELKSFDRYNYFSEKLSKALIKDISLASGKEFTLFSTLYSNNYFGISQAIELDSIISSIEDARNSGMISDEHRRWLKIALGRSMLRIANSTGHFAQYLKPKQNNFCNFLKQRRRDVWGQWLASVSELRPLGDREWRKNNKSFNKDAIELLYSLRNISEFPAAIYADPPYTDDQYSRYYHLFETLMLYDYPTTSGAGLYRPDRFRTPFSIKSLAAAAFEEMVSAVANVGADIVLSYPTNGLIYDCGADPEEVLKKYFRAVERCFVMPHNHSTFGASKGAAKASVTEQIFLGRA